MLLKIMNIMKNLFKPRSEQEMLNDFIAGNYPTTVSEVEYWQKVYDQRKSDYFRI